MSNLSTNLYCDFCWQETQPYDVSSREGLACMCCKCESSPKVNWDAKDALVEEFGKQCAFCGESLAVKHKRVIAYVIDIIPRSKGGMYRYDNVVPCCASCCSRKHNRSLDWMRERMGRLWFESIPALVNAHPGTQPELQAINLQTMKAIRVTQSLDKYAKAASDAKLSVLLLGPGHEESIKLKKIRDYHYSIAKSDMLKRIDGD